MTRPDFLSGNARLRARVPTMPRAGAVAVSELPDRLRAVPPAYSGPAREVVSVLTGRYDLADTLALLRGAVHQQPAEARRAAVHAVGALTDDLAADIAQAPDGASTAARIAAAGLPTPGSAAEVVPAWNRFELHEDVEELEADLAASAHRSWAELLSTSTARAVGWLLAWERDQRNLGTMLRLPPDPAARPPRLLPEGRLGGAELSAAGAGDLTPVHRARPGWRRALDGRRTAVAVDRALLDLLAEEGYRLLRRGDFGTSDVAVGYVLCLEAAARRHEAGAPTRQPTPDRADAQPSGSGAGS